MKNKEKWVATKFVYDKKGKLIANQSYVSASSSFMASLIAELYQSYLPKFINKKGSLLDLGCGTVPFYMLYKDFVNENYCVDWENCAHDISYIDLSADLNKKLKIDKTFDNIILSDVLEHIYNPKSLLKDCYNLLNKNGILFLNTPFCYWEHEEPFDYYRYTQYFIKKISEELGFKVEFLKAFGATNYDLLTDILSKTNKKHQFKTKMVMFFIKMCIKRICFGEPLGYFAVLRKI